MKYLKNVFSYALFVGIILCTGFAVTSCGSDDDSIEDEFGQIQSGTDKINATWDYTRFQAGGATHHKGNGKMTVNARISIFPLRSNTKLKFQMSLFEDKSSTDIEHFVLVVDSENFWGSINVGDKLDVSFIQDTQSVIDMYKSLSVESGTVEVLAKNANSCTLRFNKVHLVRNKGSENEFNLTLDGSFSVKESD